jgi:CRISPR-associated protein Cmr1
MIDLEFDLSVVTPMFLGGADSRDAELRPAPFKAAMRWWLRALIGGLAVKDDRLDLDCVRRVETAVFGSQSWRGLGSLVAMASGVRPETDFAPSRYGIAYMAGQGLKRRGYLPPGTRFKLRFEALRPDIAAAWVTSLWLLSTLGSLGSRAHRGFGRITVAPTSGLDRLPPLSETGGDTTWDDLFATPRTEELLPTIRRRLEALRHYAQRAHTLSAAPLACVPEFAVLAPEYWSLRLLDLPSTPFGDWESALDAAGRLARATRENPDDDPREFPFRGQKETYRHTLDYPEVLRYVKGREGEGVRSTYRLNHAALGLPLPFRDATVKAKAKEHDRHSPLWFPVFRGPDRRLSVGLMAFVFAFVPGGAEITRRGREPRDVELDAPGFLRDYLGLREFNQGQVVVL